MSDEVVLVCLYSGMGGVEVGARRAGVKCVLSIDCWAEAVATNKMNSPPWTRHEQIRFGEGVSGSVEAVARLILETVDGRPYHLHGSPPCQAFSLANPDERRDDEVGAEQMVWFFELLQRLKFGGEGDLWSWSCEQVPPAKSGLLKMFTKGEIDIPAFILKAMLQMPRLKAAEFGNIQHRDRLFFGEGFNAVKSLERPTIHDVLPHLQGEHDAARADGTYATNFAKCTGEFKPAAIEHLERGTICLMGSLIPGRQGCSWTDEQYGRSFRYCYNLDGTTSSIMHHPISLSYVRYLTREEHLLLAGFPSDFMFPADVSHSDRHTMIGNAVCPDVAEGVFKGLRKSREWWF